MESFKAISLESHWKSIPYFLEILSFSSASGNKYLKILNPRNFLMAAFFFGGGSPLLIESNNQFFQKHK